MYGHGCGSWHGVRNGTQEAVIAGQDGTESKNIAYPDWSFFNWPTCETPGWAKQLEIITAQSLLKRSSHKMR